MCEPGTIIHCVEDIVLICLSALIVSTTAVTGWTTGHGAISSAPQTGIARTVSAPGDCSAPGSYIVSDEPGCDDSGPGTEGTPWCTIQHAANAMTAGETACIKTGLYPGMVLPAASGSPGLPITYRVHPGHENQVVVSGELAATAAFAITGAEHICVLGLHLTGGISAGLLVLGPAADIEIDAVESFENGAGAAYEGHGIALRAGDGTSVERISIRDSEIHDNEKNGIAIWGNVSHVTIDRNHIHHCVDNIRTGRWGSIAQDGHPSRLTIIDNEIDHAERQGIVTRATDSLLIAGNHLHHNGATGVQLHYDEAGHSNNYAVVQNNLSEFNSQAYPGETGLWIDGTDDAVVRGNLLRGSETGLKLSKSNRVIVRHNLIVANNGNDLAFLGSHGVSVLSELSSGELPTTDNVFVHNTLHRNGHADHSLGELTLFGDELTGTLVKNNIVSETSAPFEFLVISSAGAEEVDFNDYHASSRPETFVWQGYIMNWDQYRAASGFDQNTLTVEPGFVSPGGFDLRLLSSSQLIDAGSPVTRTVGAGAGTIVTVADTRYFTDGWDLVDGDLIRIGSSDPVRIEHVDRAASTITIDAAITWGDGDGVGFPHLGAAPDIGALEYDANDPLVFSDGFESGDVVAWSSTVPQGRIARD